MSVSINMYYYHYSCYYYYYHYYYYYYYSYYYDYVYLGLVGSSGIFPTCIQKPQVSRTCLTIFAVPSNAAFCKSSILLFMSNFLTQSFNLFDVTPRAPINTGTNTTCVTSSRSFSLAGLWLYLTSTTKPNYCHSSKCTIFAILSCLCLYYFWASFLHSAINWLIDSSLSSHILYFSDISLPSMFFLIQFVLRACSCAANIKPSVFFFK